MVPEPVLKGRDIYRSYRACDNETSGTQGDASLALGCQILPFQGGAEQPLSGFSDGPPGLDRLSNSHLAADAHALYDVAYDSGAVVIYRGDI